MASLHERIDQFVDQHFTASFIAYTSLHDSDLSDTTLRWLVNEFIPKARAEFMQDHPEVTEADIDAVLEFLRELLTIPEDIRDAEPD
jgi:hypothetical protein